MSAAFLLSLVALFFLFQRHIDGRPLLAYQPRRSVPWGPLAAMVPLFFLVLNFFGEPSEDINPSEYITSGWLSSAAMIGIVVAAMALLATLVDANARDLGLPSSLRQLLSDTAIGIFACIASLVPIYSVLYVLHMVFQPEQQHQLIEKLLEHRSPQMMLVGFVLAVIAAPVFEEFTFRTLLQGWLERREDELSDDQESEPVQAELETDPDGEPARPQRGMIAGLPHGWAPILITSLVFGLAHVGHGVAPVPLVVFGIVLGYLYQRTHRLAASIAAHMFFNAYSMGLLWLQIG
ncbi:MAG: CPBP family intramembrane metalloprotease [Planctomycetes bacterium]|nr:CPBP family intramembrane metalloprotease [Planctomycetota bacterium]